MSDGKKIKSGFFWLTSGAIAQSLSKIIITAILSRLLTSQAFGVATFAATIVGAAELLTQISFGKSILQISEVTKKHVEVAFTVSIISSLLLTFAFLAFVNPILTKLFEYPDLTSILNVLVLLFPVRGFSQISFSLLQKEKRFKELAGIEALSYIIGYGCVATLLAFLGYGVWSLVVGSLCIAFVNSALLYYRARFDISFGFDRVTFNELFVFGTKYSLIRVINYGALKGDYVLVGKLLGAASLGVYSRAYVLMDSVNTFLGKILYTLLFPFFNANSDNNTEKAILILKILAFIFNLIIPLSLFCTIYADYIVKFLLGNGWDSAIPVFRVLSVSMIARIGYKITSSFLFRTDTVNDNLVVQTIYLVLILSGTYFASKNFGLLGVSISVSLTLYVVFFLFLYFLLRAYSGLSILAILRATVRGGGLSIVFVVCNVALRYFVLADYFNFVGDIIIILLLNLSLLVFLFFTSRNIFFESSVTNQVDLIMARISKLRKSHIR